MIAHQPVGHERRKLPPFIRLSRRTAAVLKQNIALALGIKAVFLVLALAGMEMLWMAVFADMGRACWWGSMVEVIVGEVSAQKIGSMLKISILMLRYRVTWRGVCGKSPDFGMCPELNDGDERPPKSSIWRNGFLKIENILAISIKNGNYISMSKDSNVKAMLPSAVERELRQLGENVRVARKRRKGTLKDYAERMGVSVPTLRKLEAGDPTVSMGAYATALWVIGRVQLLSEIANPETDETALMLELRTIRKGERGK